MSRPVLNRTISLTDATCLVIGCVIGVGIFRMASPIATQLPAPGLILLLWVIGGALSLCGALCYAELAAMFPATGGDYVYMTEIYGRFWGFLFGWTKLFIERTGTIAILGYVFSEYLSRVLPLGSLPPRAIAILAILGLTAVNMRGIRWGTLVQNIFSALKVGALAVLILAGFWAAARGHTIRPDWSLPPLNGQTLHGAGLALVFVLWAYGGWTEAAYVGEEVRHPTKNIPRAIVGGLLFVTGLYLLVNWSYLLFIPVGELPQTKLVASAMMQRLGGSTGAVFITCMVACSALGALNGYILTGGRILFAIGRDHRLFGLLGTVHPKHHTPALALWVNALIAIGLVLTKTLDQIATYSTVVISVFYGMTVFGVILLRRRQPRVSRPYKTWGYPVTPVVFCLVMLGFIVDVCVKAPQEAGFGFLLLAAGGPLYLLSKRSSARPAP